MQSHGHGCYLFYSISKKRQKSPSDIKLYNIVGPALQLGGQSHMFGQQNKLQQNERLVQ